MLSENAEDVGTMKHNDISALFREELRKRGLDPRDWDNEIYAFADKYNGSDHDVVHYISAFIDATGRLHRASPNVGSKQQPTEMKTKRQVQPSA